jgi:DNA-binding CsgD family transcriptional regulator
MAGRELVAVGGERFVAAVEAIYDAAAAPAKWPEALRAIADCTDDIAALLIYRRPDASTGIIMSPGMEACTEAYNSYWWQHDFRLARSAERGYLVNGDTITDRHVVTDEEMATHPFYGFLREYDLGWFAGTTVSPAANTWVGVSTSRSMKSKPAFTDDELALHTRLGRHVENALRLGIRLINSEIASATLGDALARLQVGVFLIDSMGQVAFANPMGSQLVGDGLLSAHGRLSARFASEREALDAAIVAVTQGGPEVLRESPRPILVHGLDAERFLAVYVLPVRMPSGHIVEHLLAGVQAAVVVIPFRSGERADPSIVRDLLGLTLAEARIASLVGSGFAPRQAATELGITEETARTTLKRVFDKVGVSRQSELAVLLTRLVLR